MPPAEAERPRGVKPRRVVLAVPSDVSEPDGPQEITLDAFRELITDLTGRRTTPPPGVETPGSARRRGVFRRRV